MVTVVKKNAPGGKPAKKPKASIPGGFGTKNKTIQKYIVGAANIDAGKIGSREKKILERRAKRKTSKAKTRFKSSDRYNKPNKDMSPSVTYDKDGNITIKLFSPKKKK